MKYNLKFIKEFFGNKHFNFYASWSGIGIGWIRFFGLVLHWKDTSKHEIYFSERNGYKKSLKMGSYRIRLFKAKM